MVRRFRDVVLASTVGLCSLGAAPQSEPAVSTSALPVTLRGIAIDSATPARSRCLVRCSYPGEERTASRFLAVGQRACDVAEIREILEYGVVVRNLLADRLELLTFPGTRVVPSGTPAATLERTPPAPPVTIEVSKASMDHYLTNLQEVVGSAVARPNFRDAGNGQSIIEGFELTRIEAGGPAARLGLQDGDVILEVNGDKLNSAASVLRLLGQAQSITQARLVVLRRGERMTFVVNVK